MKTIHVGGLNPIHRVTSFEAALAKANDDDTIVLHKYDTVSSIVNKNVIIKGNGHTLKVSTAKAGLTIKKPVIIENVKFKVETRANALIIEAKTILDDVSVELVGPIREFYPVIFHQKGKLTINGGRYTMIESEPGTTLVMNDVELYSYYGGNIHLSTNVNMNKFYGHTTCNNCKIAHSSFNDVTDIFNSTLGKFINIYGDVIIKDSVFNIVDEEPYVKLRKEPQRGPLNDQTNNKYSLWVEGRLTLDNYTIEQSDDFLLIYADNGVLNILNTTNEDSSHQCRIENSTITFKDTHDKTHWELRKTTPAFVRSEINTNLDVKTAMQKLDELIGLDSVKERLKSIMNTIKMNELSDDKNFSFSHHMIFAGDPGVGKTTIANITAEALFEIGAIPENKITKVTVDDLIKGYVGQTASNVKEIMTNALGGVVFIDEAYELAVKEGQNSFNSEALSVILRFMEDHRHELVVIAAGYTKEMKEFLASNVGLARRFQWVEFEDYDAQEMSDIFELIRKSYNDEYDNPLLAQAIPQLFEKLIELNLSIPDANGRITNGGNGGLVRNVYQRIIETRNNRAIIDGNKALTQKDIETGFKAEMQQALNRQL